jgi:pyruvate,water dikinase
LARLDALDPNLSELAESEQEVIEIADELWTIHFRIVIPMMLAMQVFDELHADLFGGSVDDAHVLLVGAVSESIKAGFGLSDLAQDARASGLAQVILDASPDELTASLARADGGSAFLGQLEAYLAAYGWRQDLLDYMTPTWIEDPSFALAAIRSYLQTGRDLRAEHADMARSAEDALRKARERLAAYPEPVRSQFESLLQAARAAMFLQEEHNFYIDQQGTAKLRFYYLRVGRRFVDAGLIDHQGDVMMLTSQELVDAANNSADPSLPATLRQRVATRRRELEVANGLTPPPFLGDTPPSPPPFSNPMMRGNARFWGTPVDQPEDSRELAGMAGSRGRATGVARVARILEDTKSLQPGEILVAVTTLPPWTPLFAVAAAVVTETGGPLSHCAIVAREYGIPAVVGVPGATTRIVTGQVITVDGGTGAVTIHD